MLNASEIASIIETEINSADGGESSQSASERAQALNYFFNKPRGDEIEGRSAVQSSDVNDMIEALMAQMTPMLTKETLIKFEAGGEVDEAAAEEETEFVRYLIGAASENYLEVTSAIKDALLLRLGWIRVYVDLEEGRETFTRSNIAEFQIQAEVDKSDNEQTISPITVEDSADGAGFDVSFERLIHKRTLRIESIAPENMIWSSGHDRQDLDRIRFLAERKYMTKSELRKAGYSKKVVDSLRTVGADFKEDAAARRKRDQAHNLTAGDKSQEYVETWEVHAQLDIDETGLAQLWHVHYAEKEILMKEKVEWIPYAVGGPFPVPHRLDGQSIYDKLKQNQDMSTGIYRLFMDNVALMNRPRLVYNPRITEESDVMTARPGGGIRSKQPGDVQQLVTNDMGQPLIQAMQWLDQKRTERAGAALDLGSADFQLAGHNIGTMGAERQISLKEMLAGHMTMNLANSLFKQMFLLVHKTVREYMPGQLNAKISGKWLETDASQWQERRKVIVATGLTQGEKSARIGSLTQVIAFGQQMIEAGEDGVMADRPGIYNAIMDWCRAANLSNPEQYFVDPQSQEALQAQEQKARQAEQQQQLMQQMQEQQTAIFHLQQQLEKYKHDTELLQKYQQSALDAEIEEAKIVGQATIDLQREQQRTREAGEVQAQATAAGNA